MEKKKKYLIGALVLLAAAGAAGYYTVMPKLEIKTVDSVEYGTDPLELMANEQKDGFSYAAVIKDAEGNEVAGKDLKVNEPYTLVFTAINDQFNLSKIVECQTTFVDSEAPVISVDQDEIEIDYTEDFEGVDIDFKVNDNYKIEETVLTVTSDPIPELLGDYAVTAEAVDASGNTTTKVVTVHVVDKTAPEITVSKNPYKITVGNKYDFASVVTAKDLVDGEVEVTFEGDFDAKKVGEYTIKAIAADAAGNTSEEEFTFKVSAAPVVTAPSGGGSSNGGGGESSGGATNGYYSKAQEMINSGSYTRANGYACEDAAAALLGYGSNSNLIYAGGYEVDSPAPGDVIIYFNGNGVYSHMAVYLGNGQAFHGNYSGGNPAIASAYLYSSQYYIRMGGGTSVGEIIASHGNAGWLSPIFG